MRVKGIFPPILTTFDSSGAVDERRLRSLVDFWLPHVHGMFVCGSYGSGPLLAPPEREGIFETVAGAVEGQVPLIAHVGATDTETVVRLARHAESYGAVAVAATPPFYYRLNGCALREHYQALIEAVSVPVYAYDNPKTTGNPISPTMLNELAGMGLRGLKDSSFDIGKLYMAMRTVEREDFDFVIGSESLMLPAFAMGIRGCISGLANAYPEVMCRFYEAATSGDLDEAARWQRLVLRLWDVLHTGPSVPTAYEILHLRGLDPGYPRRPLLRLTEDERQAVCQGMEELAALSGVSPVT